MLVNIFDFVSSEKKISDLRFSFLCGFLFLCLDDAFNLLWYSYSFKTSKIDRGTIGGSSSKLNPYFSHIRTRFDLTSSREKCLSENMVQLKILSLNLKLFSTFKLQKHQRIFCCCCFRYRIQIIVDIVLLTSIFTISPLLLSTSCNNNTWLFCSESLHFFYQNRIFYRTELRV